MRNKGSRILVMVAVFLFACCIYWPSFHAPFELDDQPRITFNPIITELRSIQEIWRYDPSRFLPNLSFAWNYRLGQSDPTGYHVVNFGLHFLVAFLIYLFVGTLMKKREDGDRGHLAFLCSLVFLVHPVQTSTVNYVVQRSTLMAALFYVSALLVYVQARQKDSSRYLIFSLMLGLTGAFCKPFVASLPLAILLCEICFPNLSRKRPRNFWLQGSSFILVPGVVFFLLHLWKYQAFDWGNVLKLTEETDRITRKEYFLTQLNVIVTYLRLLVFPMNQNMDYDYPIAKTFISFSVLWSSCVLVGLWLLAVKVFRQWRMISFGILFFFLTVFLESSFIPISDVIFEHRIYLPMIGFAVAMVFLLWELSPRPIGKLLIGLMILALAVLSFQRNQVWSNRIDFWQDVVAKSPKKARVHLALAVAYVEEGFYDKALMTLERAIALDPTDMQAYNNRANIYRLTGQLDLAIMEYSFILSHAPNFAFAYYFRSQCYALKKAYAQALADALKAKEYGFPVGMEYLQRLTDEVYPP